MNPKPKRFENRGFLDAVKQLACVACGARYSDPAHIKSRGAGGGDEFWNVMPLCREHHTEQHKIGWITFARKYMGVALELEVLGWQDEGGRLTHPRG